MPNSKDRSTENLTQDYLLAFSGCDEVSEELLRFFDAVLTTTRNTIKKENAALKKFRPSIYIVSTYKPQPTSISSTSSTNTGAHSSAGETDEHEITNEYKKTESGGMDSGSE